MKKSVLSAIATLGASLLSLTALPASAQTRLGVQVGANASILSPRVESHHRMGFLLGGLVELKARAPWLLRLELNLEHNRTHLRNYDLTSANGQIQSYDLAFMHITAPLSVGYRIAPSALGGVSLTPRVGIFARQGITSHGRLTSYMINLGDSDYAATTSVVPFEGASGTSSKTARNPYGTYHFAPYQRSHFGLVLGLDVDVSHRWQLSCSYKLGTGRPIQRTQSGGNAIHMNSVDLSLAYFF